MPNSMGNKINNYILIVAQRLGKNCLCFILHKIQTVFYSIVKNMDEK